VLHPWCIYGISQLRGYSIKYYIIFCAWRQRVSNAIRFERGNSVRWKPLEIVGGPRSAAQHDNIVFRPEISRSFGEKKFEYINLRPREILVVYTTDASTQR